jgi:hypothetical protein
MIYTHVNNDYEVFQTKMPRHHVINRVMLFLNQSTEGAEFVLVSECQKGEGCEIINQFVFV